MRCGGNTRLHDTTTVNEAACGAWGPFGTSTSAGFTDAELSIGRRVGPLQLFVLHREPQGQHADHRDPEEQDRDQAERADPPERVQHLGGPLQIDLAQQDELRLPHDGHAPYAGNDRLFRRR